ncbi:hypothetical protein [Levilactobacillus namurensis]|uniref:hypothetical protein n=1 Tax=Levilactobacillus namurensis TaxID=380393 RepID=UPI001D1EE739|nr:hypothetical protein [Levilactobacillus namurensis]HJE45695.1 hypothetical protein [Levilactobacillus namurensis]
MLVDPNSFANSVVASDTEAKTLDEKLALYNKALALAIKNNKSENAKADIEYRKQEPNIEEQERYLRRMGLI